MDTRACTAGRGRQGQQRSDRPMTAPPAITAPKATAGCRAIVRALIRGDRIMFSNCW